MTAQPWLSFPPHFPKSPLPPGVHSRRQHLRSPHPCLRETCMRRGGMFFPTSTLVLAQEPHAPHIPGSAEWMNSSCCFSSTGLGWNEPTLQPRSGQQLVEGDWRVLLHAFGQVQLNLSAFKLRFIHLYYLSVKVSFSMKYSKQVFLVRI